jgi:hypothetical protein
VSLSLASIASPPVHDSAPDAAAVVFTVFVFLLALGGAVAAIVRWRAGDRLLALMFASALIASFNEPIVDHLGHLWYPTDLPLGLFTTLGIRIPALVPPAYAFFGGVAAYYAWTRLRRGILTRDLMRMFVALSLFDLLLEYPGTGLHAYSYYGAQPFRVFTMPLWWVPLAGCAMLLPAFLLYLLEPRLHGRSRLLLLATMPVGFWCAYGPLAAPTFLALNTDVPEVVRWGAATVTIALCFLAAMCVARFAATDGKWRDAWSSTVGVTSRSDEVIGADGPLPTNRPKELA